MAPAFFPTKMPRIIRPSKARVLALVKTFWMSFPSRTPSVFRKVRKIIISTATSCWTDRLMANFKGSAMGGTIQLCGEWKEAGRQGISQNRPPRLRCISAASHERRVAILEEGQLVEIYIEREKEFALVRQHLQRKSYPRPTWHAVRFRGHRSRRRRFSLRQRRLRKPRGLRSRPSKRAAADFCRIASSRDWFACRSASG